MYPDPDRNLQQSMHPQQPADPMPSGVSQVPGRPTDGAYTRPQTTQTVENAAQPQYAPPQPVSQQQASQQDYAEQTYPGQGNAQQANAQQPGQSPGQLDENTNKSYLVALALSYLLGSIGADRFYLGKIGTGIAKLLTLGGLGIWQLVDMLLVAFNKLHEKGDERPLDGYAKNRSWVKILAIVLLAFNLLVVIGIVVALSLTTISGVQGKARDTERQVDLKSIQGQFEQYYAQNGQYPTVEQANDASFRADNLQGLDEAVFQDPQGDSQQFTSKRGEVGSYAYETQPADCDNRIVDCTSYTLSAKSETGQPIIVRSIE